MNKLSLSDIYFTIKAGLRVGKPISDYLYLLDDIDFTHEEINYHITIDPKKYHRKTVIRDNELELAIITWFRGQESGLHGHPGECIYKLLKGTLHEEIYSKNKISKDFIYKGDVGFIDNNKGYHNVKNVGEEFAVSIHIYSPSFPIVDEN